MILGLAKGGPRKGAALAPLGSQSRANSMIAWASIFRSSTVITTPGKLIRNLICDGPDNCVHVDMVLAGVVQQPFDERFQFLVRHVLWQIDEKPERRIPLDTASMAS